MTGSRKCRDMYAVNNAVGLLTSYYLTIKKPLRFNPLSYFMKEQFKD